MYLINNNWEQIKNKEDLQRIIEILNPEIAKAFEELWDENISTLESDYGILQDDYDLLEKECNDMTNRIKDLKEEIEKWKDKFYDLKNKILECVANN